MGKVDINNKISNQQLFFLIIVGITINNIYMSSIITSYANRASIIASFLGTIVNIPLFLWFFNITKKNPKLDIFEIMDKNFGKIIGWLFSVVFLFANIIMSVLLINIFSGFVRIYYLLETPSWFLMGLFVLFGMIMSVKGINVLGMFCQGIFFICIGLYFVISVPFIFTEIHWSNIFPPYPNGIDSFITGFLISAGATSEGLFLAFLLAGSSTNDNKTNKTVIKSILICGCTLILLKVISIGIIGYEDFSRTYTSFAYAFNAIKVKNFLTGLELMVLLDFQLLFLARFSLYILSIQKTLVRIFNAKSIGIITILLSGIIILIPSIWLRQYNNAYLANAFIDEYLVIPFFLSILLIISIAMFIKNRRRRNEN